jgi:carbamoyltransferase
MPFAPVVAEEDARAVFDVTDTNAYACRFMTITCNVKREWAERIPAVVHVDGTARPQIVRRSENPLYYDTLQAFKARTGLPAAINTSFNVHEEPIINTPEEAAEALLDDRVDYLLAEDGVYGVKGRDASR